MPFEFNARQMSLADLPEVLAIEAKAQLMPWSEQSFELSLSSPNIARVIESDEQILAYYVVSQILDELHILNVVVAPDHQGQGLGHALLHDINALAKTHNLNKLFLEVRASNTIAQRLYEQWQFKQISVRKAYYRTPDKAREDAFVYLKIIEES